MGRIVIPNVAELDSYKKKFDRDLKEYCDPRTIETIRRYLRRDHPGFRLETYPHGDFGFDAVLINLVNRRRYVEGEFRFSWSDGHNWPERFDTVHVPLRRTKWMESGVPWSYIQCAADQRGLAALWVPNDVLRNSPLLPVKNRLCPSNKKELFYHVSLKYFEFIKL
jgi:hypothetical protein